ncbi:MAG: hypothetical protein HQL23_02310 [Candidatus Omnitrophica bacterium]|nr:hypothetical protein [Candidatus Omnitrophota bacterium]
MNNLSGSFFNFDLLFHLGFFLFGFLTMAVLHLFFKNRARLARKILKEKIDSLTGEINHLERVISEKDKNLNRFIAQFHKPDENRILLSIKKFNMPGNN